MIITPLYRAHLEQDFIGHGFLSRAQCEILPDFPSLKAKINGSAQQTFDRFEKVGVQFELVGEAAVATVDTAQQAVQNTEQITSPFAENSDVMMQQVLQTMRQLDASMGQVTQFMSALNNQNSTVRRFLEDEDLYWEIRRTVENIEQASARMRPILDDVRIFTDKIARDPRQLGVKGALNNRPSGLGLK